MRNLIYSFVFEEVEEKVMFPLIRKADPYGEEVTPSECRSQLVLLMTCKQIYNETVKYVHGVVHGSIYYDRRPCLGEPVCSFCGECHRQTTVDQVAQTLTNYRHLMEYITHLDLRGDGAEAVVWEMFGGNDERLDAGDLCEMNLARTRHLTRVLKWHLPNVDSLTVFVGKEDWTAFRKRAAGLEYHRVLLGAFPKLKMICMVTDQGTQVIAERDPVLAEA